MADAFGQRARVVPTPGVEEPDWQDHAWYRFEQVSHVPTDTEARPRCPDCSTAMSTVDAAIRRHRREIDTSDPLPAFVATAASSIRPLSPTACLPAHSDPDIEPIAWQCPDCDRRVETGTADSREAPSRSLADRIRTTLAGTAGQPAEGETVQCATASFRDALRAGSVPDRTQLTTQAAYAPYRFSSTALDPSGIDSVSPTVDTAVMTNPVTQDQDRYVAVCPRARAFDWSRERPRLDLVVAIDISGSMGASLDPDGDSKLAAVTAALTDFAQRLGERDRLGVVVFDSASHVVKPLGPVSEATHEDLRSALAAIRPGGNTDIVGGHRRAQALFEGTDAEPTAERRLVLVSDSTPAMSNMTVSKFEAAATTARDAGINTSVVALDLVTAAPTCGLCPTPGSNLACVPTDAALTELFRQRVDSLLFPVATDFGIDVDPASAVIHTAPSSSADESFHRRTLFPDGPTVQSLGSVLFRTSSDPIEVAVSWTDRQGKRRQLTRRVDWTDTGSERAASDGMRVRIALQRYLAVLRRWRRHRTADDGWEATPPVAEQLGLLAQYLETELAATGVDQLRHELALLRDLQST